MTDKAIFDEKGAWGKFKTLAPLVYKLVNSKAGKGNAGDQRRALEKPPVWPESGDGVEGPGG